MLQYFLLLLFLLPFVVNKDVHYTTSYECAVARNTAIFYCFRDI